MGARRSGVGGFGPAAGAPGMVFRRPRERRRGAARRGRGGHAPTSRTPPWIASRRTGSGRRSRPRGSTSWRLRRTFASRDGPRASADAAARGSCRSVLVGRPWCSCSEDEGEERRRWSALRRLSFGGCPRHAAVNELEVEQFNMLLRAWLPSRALRASRLVRRSTRLRATRWPRASRRRRRPRRRRRGSCRRSSERGGASRSTCGTPASAQRRTTRWRANPRRRRRKKKRTPRCGATRASAPTRPRAPRETDARARA